MKVPRAAPLRQHQNSSPGRGVERPRRGGGELDSLATVLRLIRSGAAETRHEIETLSGLGRAVIVDRIATLTAWGLVDEGDLAPSQGGRAPRQVRFRAEAGYVLVGAIGNMSLGVGLADLSGRLIVEHHERSGIGIEAGHTLDRLEELFDWMLAEHPEARDVWGIGLAVTGPVELPNGRTGAESILHLAPDWSEHPVSERLRARFNTSVWVDNDAHLMALGELRAGRGVGRQDLLFLKVGTGISVGLCSDGQIHRGARGYAGDIGHTVVAEDGALCRCGNVGCLEALAGGVALAREANAATDGRSPYLAGLAATGRTLTAADVGMGAYHSDRFCIEILSRCGTLLGGTLATLVNAYNPSLVVVGGGVAQAGDILLSAMREALHRRSRSLATQEVTIVRSELGRTAGLLGAAFAVVDDLFTWDHLRAWIAEGRPSPQSPALSMEQAGNGAAVRTARLAASGRSAPQLQAEEGS
jgi:predicted NBD/HSP70 family sugar kinase